MYFSLSNTPITIDSLAAITFVFGLKLRLQSSVSLRKLKSFTFSLHVGDLLCLGVTDRGVTDRGVTDRGVTDRGVIFCDM